MAGLLDTRSNDFPESCGSEAWLINGEEYSNTAVKFWSGLLDEAHLLYPEHDELVCSAPDERPLTRGQLRPGMDVGRTMEAMAATASSAAIADAVEKLQLYGPPPAVHVCIRHRNNDLFCRDLPREYVDAEVFPHLLVWLLEWSQIPVMLWNNRFIEGVFAARDTGRRIAYRIDWHLRNEERSEGLLRRTLNLAICRN